MCGVDTLRGLDESPAVRRLKQIVQIFGGPSSVVPRVAEKDVPKVRQGRSLLDAFADGCESPHVGGRVHHGRTGSRPARPSAAAGCRLPDSTGGQSPSTPPAGPSASFNVQQARPGVDAEEHEDRLWVTADSSGG